MVLLENLLPEKMGLSGGDVYGKLKLKFVAGKHGVLLEKNGSPENFMGREKMLTWRLKWRECEYVALQIR